MSSNEHEFPVMPFPLNHIDSSPQLSLNVPNDQPRLPRLHIDQDFRSPPSEELPRASSRQFYPTDYPQDSRFPNTPFSQPNPGVPVRYPESSQRTCLQDDRAGNPMAIGSVYSRGIADVGGQGLVGSPSEYMHSTGQNDTRGPSDLYPPSLNDTPSPVSLNVLPFSERLDKIALPHGHVPPHSFYQPNSIPYGASIPPLPGPKVLTGLFSGLPNITVFEVQHQDSRRRYSSELPQMDSGDDVNTQPYTPTSPRPQNLVIDNVCCATPSSLSSIPMSNSSGWLRSQPLAPSSAFDAQPCNPIMASSLIGHSSASPISDSDSALMVPGSSSEQSEQAGRKKKKKSKMHDCEVCGKSFPRPSGLQTHMNTHSNARPFACGFPGCIRTFGVRSNAKRHLRTHGIIPSSSQDGDIPYVVGFSTPIVSLPQNPERQLPNNETQHQTSQPPFFKLRWMPQSLASRTNAASLSSVSPSDDFSEEENDSDMDNTGLGSGSSSTTLLSIPLPAVEPTMMRPGRPCSCSYPHHLSTNTLCRCMPMTFESSSSSSSSADSPSSLSTSTSGAASADDDFFQYEERNSYVETGSHPYHPSQFCVLPGPAPRML